MDRMAALFAGTLILTAPAVSSAIESDATNKQLLQLCQTDPAACREDALQQARASALALKILEIQTDQCIVDFPEGISAEVLADVGLNYIRKIGDPDGDVGLSFSRAFWETYPCPK